jgi:hypothetical protein
MSLNPTLQKILKGILHTEEDKDNHENIGTCETKWMSR